MWLAHALTVARLPLAVGFWLTYGSVAWSLGWVAAAAVSDALDGRAARWARRRAGVPESAGLGAVLDPLFDKVFVVIALAAIVAHDRSTIPMVVALAARELVLAPLFLVYAIGRRRGRTRIELRAHAIGKAATVVQFFAVMAIVVPDAAQARWPLAIAACGLGVAAVGEQLTRIRSVN